MRENTENGDVWLVSYNLGTRSFWYLARKDNLDSASATVRRTPELLRAASGRRPPSSPVRCSRETVGTIAD